MHTRSPECGLHNRIADCAATANRLKIFWHKAETPVKWKLLVLDAIIRSKLLYANKLLQNREINVKQQYAIVEALDEAKTLREAKLLYKSLTSSLEKNRKKVDLSEGKVSKPLGSSSKSTRSSGAKNGSEVERWAVLAGIGSK